MLKLSMNVLSSFTEKEGVGFLYAIGAGFF